MKIRESIKEMVIVPPEQFEYFCFYLQVSNRPKITQSNRNL